MKKEVYYSDYLQLEKILSSQQPESGLTGSAAHDEMLFIIVHQTYELWFKQLCHELKSVVAILSKEEVSDNSPDIFIVVHRLKRVSSIWDLAIHQVGVIETMTPLDFLDFREQLRPASGFQSFQFKALEAMMGLKFDERHGQEFYRRHLRAEHQEMIAKVESRPSLLELTVNWLERMPYFEKKYWTQSSYGSGSESHEHPFWVEYKAAYNTTLSTEDKQALQAFNQVFFNLENSERRFSDSACRAALFIMAYRDYPLLQIPFQLLDTLITIDEQMATWRARHISMVKRMIGSRAGTGGSTGAAYLKESRDRHLVYSELAEISSFLVQRNNLPKLSPVLEKKLGFTAAATI